MLLAAVAGQVNGHGLERDALEVEGDARAIGRRGAKIGIQFHDR
jgi:hypothetical protein